jgi:ABC-type transport system substrate-binding protein
MPERSIVSPAPWTGRRWTRRSLLTTWTVIGFGAGVLSACSSPAPVAVSTPGLAPTSTRLETPASAAATPAAATAPTPAPQPGTAQTSSRKAGGTYRFVGWTEDPPTLDPYLNVSFRTQEFAAFFYSRLLMSKKGPGIAAQAYIMEGDLAQSWKTSDDGLTYTFSLRPDAQWQNQPPLNGRPVTAGDVVWSFEHFMKVSPQKSTFDMVANVVAPDDRTVQFTLKEVYAPFEAAIGGPVFWILPREVVEQDGDVSKRVVGSGPFIFDHYESSVSFTAHKNPAYYRKGEPNLDQLVGLIIPDTATQLAGLRGGELDGAPIAQQDLDSVKGSNPEIQLVEWEFLYIPFVYWKLDKPPFSDVRVRQAISMGMNRDARVRIISNGRGNWNNFVPWALTEWWLDPRGPDMGPNAKYYQYDPAAARQLLADAGYPNGLQVDLISTPGYGQVWVQGVELMVQDLKSIGVEAALKMQEYSSYVTTTFQGKFEGGNVLVYGLETPFTEPHDFLFAMHHPKGVRNHAGVNDAKLNAMIEQQARTLDRAVRKAQIFEIQRYLAEQMYYPPGTAGTTTVGLAPYVRDFYPISDFGRGAEVYPKVWLDK